MVECFIINRLTIMPERP